MNFFSKFRKFNLITTAIGFIVVGLVLVCVSGGIIIKENKSDIVYEETEATIVSITEESVLDSTGSSSEYHVFVDYTANGKTFRNAEYGSYSSSMKVGDKVPILYDPANPENTRTPGTENVPYILMAIGGLGIIFGIYSLVKNSKKKAADFNEYDRVDMSRVDPETVAEIENSTEETHNYVFHYAGKLNQGYVLRPADGDPVYEARVIEINALKPYVYDFVNYLTGETVTRKIGHVVTTGTGTGAEGFSFSVPITKSFTVDGQNNWDYLADNGYSFDFALEGIAVCFNVKHYGVPVAYIKTAGTNTMTGKDHAIGNLPVNGIYEVECRDSDLDMVFMVCVSISRAIFYQG